VLAAGVALWSFGTLIAPPAAQMGILWLCASRALVGLGEGVAPSAATTVLARLMPSNERARAVSLVGVRVWVWVWVWVREGEWRGERSVCMVCRGVAAPLAGWRGQRVAY